MLRMDWRTLLYDADLFQIWQSAWERCSDLSFLKTLIIHIFPEVLRSSGEDGIFHWEAGSVIMSIYPLEARAYPRKPVWF